MAEERISPVLVIMAAGMGSRYGGLKQVDPVDKKGHLIIDYSIYDAYRAGFREVVFVVREENAKLFRETIGDRVARAMRVSYAFQRLTDLPKGFAPPAGRTKPWGTGQAVLAAKEAVHGAPFAVINADDYYGPEAFRLLYDALSQPGSNQIYDCVMVGYLLKNTVTSHGYVSRGVCRTDAAGRLVSITERTHIEVRAGEIAYTENGGDTWTALPGDTVVSMNCWGFPGGVMGEIDSRFAAFLKNEAPENLLKAEYYLPALVSSLLAEGKAAARVLVTGDKWHGVTYHEDKPEVVAALKKMTEEGLYPDGLLDA